MRITQCEEGCILEVAVKPRSKCFKVESEGDEIQLLCREEPVKGKVNKEIINELSKLFHKRVELVSGFSSRQKRLLVKGITKTELEKTLNSL